MFRPSSQAQAIHHANPEINSIQSRAEDRFGETFLEQPGHISFFILFGYTEPYTTLPILDFSFLKISITIGVIYGIVKKNP